MYLNFININDFYFWGEHSHIIFKIWKKHVLSFNHELSSNTRQVKQKPIEIDWSTADWEAHDAYYPWSWTHKRKLFLCSRKDDRLIDVLVSFLVIYTLMQTIGK